jgi:SPP1 family predicted phage head-tail adaptor
MRAGKLDRTIIIQRQTETVKPSGAVVTAWTEVATVRAEIAQQSATEFLAGYGEAENGTVIFRIRYLPGITTNDRVNFGGVIHDLKEIKELGRRRGLELRAVATS